MLEAVLNPRPESSKDAQLDRDRRQVLGRIAALPGVISVGFSTLRVPAGDGGWRDTVGFSRTDANSANQVLSTIALVSPGFLRTLGIPVLSGRDFEWADDDHHPSVALVDGDLAHRLAASRNIVGERIRFGVQPQLQDLEIVGVVRSARIVDLRSGDMPVVYVPYLQHGDYAHGGFLFVRGHHPSALARAVSAEVQAAGREYAMSTETLQDVTDQSLIRERASAMLSGFFAAVALLLAALGLFGLMSYSVTLRTKELGIRLALGSPPGKILRMVLQQALLLTLLGIAVGLPCAFLATRLIGYVTFLPEPASPAILIVVSATLSAVGLAAGARPALRAMRLDPITALRHE